MKTYQINRVLVVAAVAFLPIACGTSSPTGPDFAADAAVSALRFAPAPPQAPSPESAPVPVPSPVPSPKSNPGPAPQPTDHVSTDRDDRGPAPAPNPGPAPQPGTVADPAPGGPVDGLPPVQLPNPGPATHPGTGSDPAPSGPVGGLPPVQLPNPGPATHPGSGSDPAPVNPVPPPSRCLAESVRIVGVNTFAPSNELELEAILLDSFGGAITDQTCERVSWKIDGTGVGSEPRVVITYGSSTRLVTITGLGAGTYKIGATAPNGVTTSFAIVVR